MNRWWYVGVGPLLLAGCGPTRTEMSGIVRFQGKPVTKGEVIVVDADRMPHTCRIGSDGSYTVKGVPVGPVQLAVSGTRDDGSGTPSAPPERRERGRERPVPRVEDRGQPPLLLPPRYRAPATSGLSTTLKPEPTNTFDLELEP
jgi:hypothetical protein